MPRANVLKNLPTLNFRGIDLPYSDVEVGFSHESAKNKFIFRNEQLVKQLGRTNETFKYTIPLAENFQKKFSNAFSEKFNDLYNACLDEKPGILTDPFRGETRAVCVSMRTLGTADAHDMAQIEVEFIKSPKEAQAGEPSPPNIETIKQQAESLDDSADFPDLEGFEQPFVNPFDLITIAADQVSFARNQVLGTIDKEIGRVKRAEKSIDEVSDIENWNVKEKLRDYQASLISVKDSIAGDGSKIKRFTVQNPAPLIVLADLLDQDFEAFLKLNADLSDEGDIPSGTVIRFFG